MAAGGPRTGSPRRSSAATRPPCTSMAPHTTHAPPPLSHARGTKRRPMAVTGEAHRYASTRRSSRNVPRYVTHGNLEMSLLYGFLAPWEATDAGKQPITGLLELQGHRHAEWRSHRFLLPADVINADDFLVWMGVFPGRQIE